MQDRLRREEVRWHDRIDRSYQNHPDHARILEAKIQEVHANLDVLGDLACVGGDFLELTSDQIVRLRSLWTGGTRGRRLDSELIIKQYRGGTCVTKLGRIHHCSLPRIRAILREEGMLL